MAKLKLGAIADDKPVKLTVELPAAVHRDLLAYATEARNGAIRLHRGNNHAASGPQCCATHDALAAVQVD